MHIPAKIQSKTAKNVWKKHFIEDKKMSCENYISCCVASSLRWCLDSSFRCSPLGGGVEPVDVRGRCACAGLTGQPSAAAVRRQHHQERQDHQERVCARGPRNTSQRLPPHPGDSPQGRAAFCGRGPARGRQACLAIVQLKIEVELNQF